MELMFKIFRILLKWILSVILFFNSLLISQIQALNWLVFCVWEYFAALFQVDPNSLETTMKNINTLLIDGR